MAKNKKYSYEDEEEWEDEEEDGADDVDPDAEDIDIDPDSIEENEAEVEDIEAKLESGEGFSSVESEASLLLKARTVYSCPRCRRIYFQNKWQRDTITDLYTVRTEMAYCNRCLEKGLGAFVGSVEVYDKDLAERKESFISSIRTLEAELEHREPFDKIIDIVEKNGILYIFTNTTRLAVEIGRKLSQEWHGAKQIEWFERNQFVRIKWFAEVQNREYFRSRIRAAKEKRIGLFSFEED